MARAITIGSIVFTVASLTLAAVFARKRSRVRLGFDFARAVVGIGAILAMAAVTKVTTPTIAVVLAVAVGFALGFAQGSTLDVSREERGLYAKRGAIGVVLWGAGIVTMQAAGIASRTGTVRLGQTLAWFSACLGIGLMVGRTGPLRRTLAGASVAAIGTALLLPTIALLSATAVPATAQAIQLTDGEVCDLTPRDGSWSTGPQTSELEMSFNVYLVETDEFVPITISVPEATAACANRLEGGHSDGSWFRVAVYQLQSADEALDAENSLRSYLSGWATIAALRGAGTAGADARLADFGTDAIHRVAFTSAGSFLVVGTIEENSDFNRGEYDVILAERMATAVANIEALTEAVAPPPVDDTTETTRADATTTTQPPDDRSNTPPTGIDGSTADADEAIDPEEAAAQAIIGLIAAAAIGLITWAEAAAGIGTILGDRGGGGVGGGTPIPEPPPAPPPGPFIDPYDDKPLQVDPETGMVFWPWDGHGGHHVDPSEVPALIDDWNRELEAETAARVARHNAQREQNWRDLHDRIRRSGLEDASRRAAEQARLDDFDRRIEIARTWMEEAGADSLGVLDRIMQRVANQGYATDADIELAGLAANRARSFTTTMERMNAEDWIRINNNRNTVLEVTAKAASIMLDPTKGLVSGAIWGGMESRDRGDTPAMVVANALGNAATFRTSHAIGTWAPGQAALGRIGWGSFSGSATAAGETLLRGGTLEDARQAAPVGFVFGGLGGIAEEAATIGTKPPARVPTITTQRGGPRVAHDTPTQPSLRPPERGGVSVSDPLVPRIVVEPGEPRVHYDEPLDPRHIDPDDPRFIATDPRHPPPGRPVLVPEEGPPVPTPPSVSPADAFDPPPPVATPGRPPPVAAPGRPPPVDMPDKPPPPRLIPEQGVDGGRPPVDTSPPSPVDALDRPPLGDLPERIPPTPEQLLEGARPTRPTPDILDDMMRQPRNPSATDEPGGAADWQRGFFPDADGRSGYIDPEGRVLVKDRHIGNVDPDTGALRNLDGEPMTVALDERGVPAGYVEQPDVPQGMSPVYDARGNLAGHVDSMGRADIGGERVPIAFDSDGNLVPYQAPPSTTTPAEYLPPEGLRGQSRLPGTDVEPTTGALVEPPAAAASDSPAPTGQIEAPPSGAVDTPIDYTPYGQPISTGDGQPPASLSDLDTGPRIPVLDDNGSVSYLVEPGPREIRYNADGTPHFVQRQHPVQSTTMEDIVIDPLIAPPELQQMPTPEVFDATEAWFPLSGEGAPPTAPDVIPPIPPGSDPP